MLNHFRTLLLNLSYAGDPTEDIPENMSSELPLPVELLPVYNTFFPKGISRLYKKFLVQNYLTIIKAAGLESAILEFDPRISYSDDPNFFKVNRITNPIISDGDYPIFVFGKYQTNAINQNYYDNFLISQVKLEDAPSSPMITVYSKVRDVYIVNGFSFPEPYPESYIHLDFIDGNTSNPVLIDSLGIRFIISGKSEEFCNSYDKTWEFIVEAPYVFEFNKIFNKLLSENYTDSLFNYRTDVDVTKYENYWKLHYNPVYRMAGLLIALVKKINTLL